MRISDLFEAPIADLAVSPDPNPKRWLPADLPLLKNEKAVKKIMNMFDRTPFVFNFYMIMNNTPGLYGADMKQTLETLMGKPIDTEGKITVCYTFNRGNPKRDMPMNAWTMAHRMIHTMQVHSNKEVTLHPERVFWAGMVDIAHLMSDIPATTGGVLFDMIKPEKPMIRVVSALLTMKSARDDRIALDLDVGGEILAQYLFSGKVKFRPVDDFLALASQRLAHAEDSTLEGTGQYSVNKKVDRDAVQARLTKLARDTEAAIEKSLTAMQGGIYAF